MKRVGSAALFTLALAACAGGAKKTKVGPPKVRTTHTAEFAGPPDTPNWSGANAEAAAKQLAASFLRSPGVKALQRKLSRAPLLHLRPLRNRTAQHILGRMILQLFEQRVSEKGFSVVPASSPSKADLVLTGMISGHEGSHGRRVLRATTVNLDALHALTGETLWVGLSTVRKLIVYPPTPKTKQDGKAKDGKSKATPPPKVTRLKADDAVALSGSLDDLDLRLAAQAAAGSATRWASKSAKPPVIKLYPIRNRSSQRIPTGLLTKALQAALLGSGKVRLVAGFDEIDAVRSLRNPAYRALAAEVVLNGQLTAQIEKSKARYEISLKAVNVDNQQTVWSFSKVVNKKVPPPAKDKGQRPTW